MPPTLTRPRTSGTNSTLDVSYASGVISTSGVTRTPGVTHTNRLGGRSKLRLASQSESYANAPGAFSLSLHRKPSAHPEGGITLKRVKRQLPGKDQALLREIFEDDRYHVVLHETFNLPAAEAEKQIFDDAPAVPRPDVSWYQPMITLPTLSEATRILAKQKPGGVLLTAEQERALFYQFNYCRFRVMTIKLEVLGLTMDDRLTSPELRSGKTYPSIDNVGALPATPARTMLKWAKKADAYREQIAQTNLALVLAMAKRSRARDVEFGDLVSEGNMALLRATDKFDASRGFKFSTYACRAILKAFSRIGIKTTQYRQRFPTEFDPQFERSNHAETQRRSHEEECADEVRLIFEQNRAELSDIEQEVIEHRFGLSRDGHHLVTSSKLTLDQVGKLIGVTKERVRQIQNKAMVKIRETLETEYLY